MLLLLPCLRVPQKRMKTNLDFLDTGSYLYLFIALAILMVVLWSFLHEAIKPLVAFLKKPRSKPRRAPNAKQKAAAEPQWNTKQAAGFSYRDDQLNRGLKTH
jgi:hypothetical protein